MSDANMESETKMEVVNNENEQPEFAKPSDMTPLEIEKAEEAKLKAKYAFKAGPAIGGHSTFLQKKLAKGQKYFDSGDYQMAKQSHPGGGAGNKLLAGGAGGSALAGAPGSKPVPSSLGFGCGDAIPTPESVPARKTSIIQPKFTPLHTIPSTPTGSVCPSFVPNTAASAPTAAASAGAHS
uniref:Alpha-endosulfine n=1 Tax=Cacopsylla melanoneura TaxID=428564 RepID=A0A8D8TLE6_9HEMI